jgi:hypothetical protein
MSAPPRFRLAFIDQFSASLHYSLREGCANDSAQCSSDTTTSKAGFGMNMTQKRATLSANTQTMLSEIHQELTTALNFYTDGLQRFPGDTPFGVCAELAERHLHKLDRLLHDYDLSVTSDRGELADPLPADLHAACHAALKFALERDQRYKSWIAATSQTDIHQLLCNIEHGIHDRGIPSFKQYLEHQDI